MTPPNDWEIKKCLTLSLAILLAIVGLIEGASLGFDVPGLRQVIGFIFLTFIPGILILRILKIHNIGVIESLLYSVGLSIAFVMFSGLLMNFALPLIGISRPISTLPVAATLAVFTIILMATAYVRDKGFSASIQAGRTELLSPSLLFLVLVFLIAILGALMVNFYQSNVLLLIFILAVAGVVGLAAFGKFIDPKAYPVTIAIIGITLLYQTTLISPYLTGSDIHGEYYFHQLVVENGYWDSSIARAFNSALSVVMLSPIYTVILNTDGAWVFKIIYPFIFSLVPLALFHIYRQQISANKAFLAVFFFMAVPTYSLEIIGLAKQQIAELFFALFILLMVDEKLRLSQRLTLAIIFALSIAVSHYGLGFISLIYFTLGWLLLMVIRSGWGRRVWGWVTKRSGGLPASLLSPQASLLKTLAVVVVIYLVCSLAFYGWAASGKPMTRITNIWQKTTAIVTGEPGRILELTGREPLIRTAFGLDFASASNEGKGFRILQYITQLFIVIGFIRLVFKPKKLRFTAEYIAFSVVSALILAACLFLPTFSSRMNATRFYHVALFLLAPFCILGGETIWLGACSLLRKTGPTRGDDQAYLRFMALGVLIPYFLFTSGFVFEVARSEVTDVVDTPYSVALSSYRLDIAGVFNLQDGAGADWLAQRLGDEHAVYADAHSCKLLGDRTELRGRRIKFPEDMGELPPDSYIYFRTWNVDKQEITFWTDIGLRRQVSFDEIGLTPIIEARNRIYDNGSAQVLAPR